MEKFQIQISPKIEKAKFQQSGLELKPKRNLSSNIKFIIGIVSLLVIATVALFVWNPFRPNSEKVISKMLLKMEKVDSLHYLATLNVESADESKLLVKFDNDLERNSSGNTKSSGTFNITNNDYEFNGEYRNIKEISFIKIDKTSNTPFLGVDFFKLPSNQWIKIDNGLINNQYRLVVKFLTIDNVNEAIKIVGDTPFVEFKIISGKEFIPTELTGRYLEKAEVSFNPPDWKSAITLKFNEDGSNMLEKITTENIGKILAVYIDEELISAPVIKEKILDGEAKISGDFTKEEAMEIVRSLSAGALPVPINFVSGTKNVQSLSLIYDIDLLNTNKKDYESIFQKLEKVIEKRVNIFRVEEATVTIQPKWRITEIVENQRKIAREFENWISDKNFYVIKEKLPDDNIGDKKVYHYILDLDKEKLKKIIDLLEDPKLSSSIENQEKIFSEIWIDKEDNYLHKFKLSAENNDISLTIEFSDFDEPIDIKEPKDYKSFKKIISELE